MKNNGNGYISLYLIIAETDTYAPGWEVNVNFKFLVYDQIEDKFLTIQDSNGIVRRFHEMKKEWGIAQLLPFETFKTHYLANDSCVFGVDVVVMKYAGNWESISLIKELKNDTFTWKMENFSKLNRYVKYSKVFNFEGINWKLVVYPNGDNKAKDKSLSIFLRLEDWGSHPMKKALYAKYKFRVLDQVNGNHHEIKDTDWFKGGSPSWGFSSFMSLSDLRDASKGFIVKDTLIVEVVFRSVYTKVSNLGEQVEASVGKNYDQVSCCTIL